MTAWQQLNPHGAGFQNCGGLAPWAGHDTDLIVGGDTAGLHKTTNKGKVWANRDGDLTPTSQHGASVEPHPTQQGRWFALMGNGTTGALWESTDNGDNWTNVSSGEPNINGAATLAGNSGTGSLLGPGNGEHPRSVGRLIAIDAAGGYIYVGTFKHGVYRGTLGASSGVTAWTQIGLVTNFYVRGVVYDPANDALYASTYSDPGSSFTTAGGRIYRCTTPHGGSTTFTQLTGSPICSQTMIVLSDRLYAVAAPITANLGSRGLWYLDAAHSAAAGSTWTQITALPISGSQRWMSLDGYKVGPNTTLWAGCASSGATSLCKLTSPNGSTWTAKIYPTAFADLQNDMGGPNTPPDPWWMYTARKSFMLGQSTFVAATIRINPQNTQEIYVFGRSGVWQTKDGGVSWYPVVKGIGATVTLTVLCDPKHQNNVYVGLGDWSVLTSQDDLATVQNPAPPSGSFSYSMCLDENVTPTAVITSASARSDVTPLTSNIYRNENIFGGGAWVDTGFVVSGALVVALAVVYSGATRVFIAGDSLGNMWRKVGNGGAWSKILTANMSPGGGIALTTSDTQPIARDITRAETYLYDRGTGVWRSIDAGLHWTRIWNHPAGNSSDQSGWVDVDPTSKKNLFVSDSTSVYKITNADTCAQDAATVVTLAAAIGAKGPMAVDKVNKRIGLCDITSTAKFWESDMTNISWVNNADSLYFNAAGTPQWLSYDTAGHAHVALSGNGIISQSGTATSLPANTALPAVLGSPIEGSILTESDGTWSGVPAPTLTRKWQISPDNAAWSDVSPAQTGTSYAIPTGGTVLGSYYRVAVTGTNTGGTVTANSASVGPVVSSTKPVNTVLPVISGTAKTGQVLSVTTGTWLGTPTFAYQWETSATGTAGTFTSIGGATANTYTIIVANEGSYVRCKVTGTNVNGATDAWATKVGPVVPLVAPNTAPVIAVTGPADVVVLPATPLATATASDADGIAGVTVSLDQGTPLAMASDGAGGWQLDLGVISVGSHFVHMVATDSNASPLTAAADKAFSVITGDSGGGGGGTGGGVVTISTDIAEIEFKIHQRGLG